MKKIDVGQTLNTIANLGVIVGIVFLAFELRQGNVVAVNDSFTGVLERFAELNWYLISDERVAELYLHGREDLSSLDATEQFQFERLMHQWFMTQEQAMLPVLQGIAAPDTEEAIQRAIAAELSYPGTREWWKSDRNDRAEWFKTYVDELLDQP
jgi:hypothetical protein